MERGWFWSENVFLKIRLMQHRLIIETFLSANWKEYFGRGTISFSALSLPQPVLCNLLCFSYCSCSVRYIFDGMLHFYIFYYLALGM
jgi:hypothetical protein